jgi:hypothetical protein
VGVGQKFLDFPLLAGKAWPFSFLYSLPGADLYKFRSWHRVLGCEDVSTSAGRFAAFKVEVVTRPDMVRAKATPAGTSGTYYHWYAPHVKWVVKRQIVPSQWFASGNFPDFELMGFETK